MVFAYISPVRTVNCVVNGGGVLTIIAIQFSDTLVKMLCQSELTCTLSNRRLILESLLQASWTATRTPETSHAEDDGGGNARRKRTQQTRLKYSVGIHTSGKRLPKMAGGRLRTTTSQT